MLPHMGASFAFSRQSSNNTPSPSSPPPPSKQNTPHTTHTLSQARGCLPDINLGHQHQDPLDLVRPHENHSSQKQKAASSTSAAGPQAPALFVNPACEVMYAKRPPS
ncbi:hypothetical protein Cob_v010302 [Colletotrichum orbiculare MAFF 240422]|uniref:Uncharacterized protein n=1 Tax=Colletotrichum orbiculare (strain 104-T / ATCC 96160 / CBS 514.97 / LARS 414 / MAFF 240422) TaxID=1213857 RepID=A0A484FGH8_COLOR|nr:hypothetical protein Cob_v010302 [Colletotrichum orbiculare MAFF 240422]